MSDVRTCSMCDQLLMPGANSYILELKLFADFDGIIDLKDERSLDKLLEDAGRLPEETLEDQIYMERRHLLCPQCRLEMLEMLPEKSDNDDIGGNGNADEDSEPIH